MDTSELLWPFNRLNASFVSLCMETYYYNVLAELQCLIYQHYLQKSTVCLSMIMKRLHSNALFFVQLFSILLEGFQILRDRF